MNILIQIILVAGGFATFAYLLIYIYRSGYKTGQKSYEVTHTLEREQLRLNRVYAPLRKKLIDCHLTTVTFVKYPYFKMRWKRALPFLKRFNLKKCHKSLIDKEVSTDTGVDYGYFDLSYIEKIVKDNIDLCDSELVFLLQCVLREKHEMYPFSKEGILYKEELKLIEHIYDEYAKLSKKLMD